MRLSVSQIKQMQSALRDCGLYGGKIDGDPGPLTRAAIVEFKRSVGLRPRPYVGPITWGALIEGRPPQPKLVPKEPPWLRNARAYRGLTEWKGSSHNPKILQWWKLIGSSFEDDETPWCAAFVGGIFEEYGIKSSRSAMARSYEKWGYGLDKPAVGCVVTFWRGPSLEASHGRGHVALVVGQDQNGSLMCLGGNQKDAVNIKPFSIRRVTSYRWPVNTKYEPYSKLPLVGSDGQLSTNEA